MLGLLLIQDLRGFVVPKDFIIRTFRTIYETAKRLLRHMGRGFHSLLFEEDFVVRLIFILYSITPILALIIYFLSGGG